MTIRRVHATAVTQVRQFWRQSRHLYHNLGAEDLPHLLAKEIALFAEERGEPWGFVCLQAEERPATLPPTAPNRAYLRAVALGRGRSPSLDVATLLQAALSYLSPAPQGHLLITYADADWLRLPLFDLGFILAEEVQFWELAQVQRWRPPPEVTIPALQLRPAQMNDLPALAQVDAAAFPPLWHFDVMALQDLLFTSRVVLATREGQLVGYTALSTSVGGAHLARIAVHPQQQGHGLGKYLLLDALRYAQQEGFDRVMLNTQVQNHVAQQLYRQVGFRPTGHITPVLTWQITP
ncbi:MAG: GNAT family N-acetyltransferase [Caldilineaceae bacterium]|nr:GNAT family N-acetyltransferase [Caldilineaceae bacterium]